MSCPCDNQDICLFCGDTVTVEFEQCGAAWPAEAESVTLKFSSAGCCGGGNFEVEALAFDLTAPGKVSFKIPPSVTAALPRGARTSDYRVYATSATGERTTFLRGRVTVK